MPYTAKKLVSAYAPELSDREQATVNGVNSVMLKGLADLTVWYSEQLPTQWSQEFREELTRQVHIMLVARIGKL